MRPIVTDVAWSICLIVCLFVRPLDTTLSSTKNGRIDRATVSDVNSGGTKEPCIGGMDIPTGRYTFGGRKNFTHPQTRRRAIFSTSFARGQQRCDPVIRPL